MIVNTGGKDFNLQVGVYANTDPITKQIKTFINQAQKTSDIKLDVKVNSQGRQTVRQIKTETGDLVTVTKQYNKQGQLLNTTINKLSREYNSLTNATKQQQQAQQALNATAQRSKGIFNDFADTFMKMAKFNTINLIYDAFTDSVSNAVQVVEEFNTAITELRKVSDLEGESLKSYTQELGKYGEVVGRTLTDMVNSATIFKRTGATDEEAAKLAQIAEMYRNVADNEISSAEASSFLVSQMKAFNITAEQSIHIIDVVNKTANEHAVSTNDLQVALSKASASMATANNTYEETVALVEGATAIMQGQAGTVGNGLRTLAINIASLAAESDNFVAANGKVNISLKDEQGQLRSTYQILNDLSKVWKELAPSEQMAIAKTLGGKTRFNVITSLMRNFADAQQTLDDALNSTNSAIEENSRYMESISA